MWGLNITERIRRGFYDEPSSVEVVERIAPLAQLFYPGLSLEEGILKLGESMGLSPTLREKEELKRAVKLYLS